MTTNISLTIDGQKIVVGEGISVLDAAFENDIYIPHLCHHPDLNPAGACRLCGVEINGGNIVMACMTPVQEGMEVRTNNQQIYQSRKTTLELLIADHDMDCLACQAADDCKLLTVSSYLGLKPEEVDRLRPLGRDLPLETSNPFFQFDPNKCVLCGICIRTCDEIVGQRAIGFINRGFKTVIGTFGDKGFKDSICESCGECVIRCPVGALSPYQSQKPAREVETTCVYCGVGCGIHLGVKGDQITSVRADRDRPTNEGSLCVKGRYGFGFVNHPDRLTMPLIRKNGELVETSWDEALTFVADKFSKSKGEKYTSLASAKCTNEDNYVFQKFTRAVMGTNNVDHCARL